MGPRATKPSLLRYAAIVVMLSSAIVIFILSSAIVIVNSYCHQPSFSGLHRMASCWVPNLMSPDDALYATPYEAISIRSRPCRLLTSIQFTACGFHFTHGSLCTLLIEIFNVHSRLMRHANQRVPSTSLYGNWCRVFVYLSGGGGSNTTALLTPL